MTQISNHAIVSELKNLSSDNGGFLLPEVVVESARPKNSVLHGHFMWDDTKAAQEFRLVQARNLIRICVHSVKGVSEPVKVFVNLSSDRISSSGYRQLVDVLSNENEKEVLLADALAELTSFQRKYSFLLELSHLFGEISETVRTLKQPKKDSANEKV